MRADVISTLRQIAEEGDEHGGDVADASERTVPTVRVPGIGPVHKATLVAQLNRDPNVSAERLRRVRSAHGTKKVGLEEDMDTTPTVGLYDDLAILIRGKNPSFLIARVVRIRNKVPSGRLIEYKQPIFVTDFDKYPDGHVLVRKYTPMDDQIFKLGDEFLASFLLKDVISPVALTYDVDSDQLCSFSF